VADLAPIASRLATFIRLLASDKDGEVVAAARALIRTLQSVGADIHGLAEHVEHPDGGALTEAEMQKIFDAGVEVVTKRAKQKQRNNGAPQLPSAHKMALFCHERSKRLHREKDREFVRDMVGFSRQRARLQSNRSGLRTSI
jgi:hypothetical protein